MSPTIQSPGPMKVSNQPNGSSPSLSKRLAQFEHGITLSLFLWPSLSLAVSNNWGGLSSSSKREWFAGTLIDLLKEEPEADVPLIEQFLLQVMEDEFEVVVDDGSAMEVAERIVRLKGACERGDFEEVTEMDGRWRAKGGKGEEGLFKEVEGEEGESSDSEEEGEDEEDEDVEMDEAPQLVKTKEKEQVLPQVDEEGFTKVTKKKR